MVRLGRAGLVGLAAVIAAGAVVAGQARGAGQSGGAGGRVPFNPVEGGEGFTVLVAEDATVGGSRNAGTMALGGDLVLDGRHDLGGGGGGTFVAAGDRVASELVVGGRIDFARSAPGAVLAVHGGHVKIGDLRGARVRTGASTLITPHAGTAAPRVELTARQLAPSVGPLSPLDLMSMFADFRERADALAACQGTVSIADGRRVRLERGRTNVLRVRGSELGDVVLADRPSRDAPLLVVVTTGDTFTWPASDFGGLGRDAARHLMFVLPTTATITLPAGRRGMIPGTVFAPRARLVDRGGASVLGGLVVRQWTDGAGTVRPAPFRGLVECPEDR